MATTAQILANRRNARKSTGPRTPKGKTAVAQNAVKHALTAKNETIVSESPPEFQQHRDLLLTELAPAGPMESILAERIVSLSWRLKRANRFQNRAIDTMNDDQNSTPMERLTRSFLPPNPGGPRPRPSDPHSPADLGRLAVADFSNSRILERLLMYERRIEHSLYKTILELQRLQFLRKLRPHGHDDNQTSSRDLPEAQL